MDDQVVAAAGVAGGLHAQLARRVGTQEIALQDAVDDHFAVAGGHAVAVEGAARERPPGRCGRSLICTCASEKTACRGCREGKSTCGTALPPLTACTKLPISADASGASKSTGTLQVLIFRAPRRDRARRAA
jgi:hypothetical protein